MFKYHVTAVLIGCFLDACFGDPLFLWHPVCGIGNLISWLEKKLRPVFSKDETGERQAGVWLVVLVLLAAGGLSFALLSASYSLSPIAGARCGKHYVLSDDGLALFKKREYEGIPCIFKTGIRKKQGLLYP